MARPTFDAESLALARERQQLIHDTARVLRGCVFGVWTATPPRDGGDCDSSTSSSSSESSLELYDDHCASPVVEVPPPPSSPPPGWVAPAAASDERITVIRHPTTRRLSAVLRDDAHVTAATLEVTPPPRAPVVLPSDPFARVGRAARTREPFAVDKAWVKRMLSVNERRLHAVSDPATETMAAEEGPPPRNCAALERYIGTLESDAAARRKFMQHCRQLRDARAAPESAARCATPRLADGGGCSAFEKLRSQRQAQARKAHRQRKDPSYGPAPGTITRADQRRLRNRRGREALQIAAVATAAMRFARTLQTLKTLRSVVLWVQRTWRHRMLQRTLELRRRMLDKDNTILLTAARKRWASSQDMHAHILCMFLRQARFNASPEAHARAPPQTPPPRCPPQSLSRQCSSGGGDAMFRRVLHAYLRSVRIIQRWWWSFRLITLGRVSLLSRRWEQFQDAQTAGKLRRLRQKTIEKLVDAGFLPLSTQEKQQFQQNQREQLARLRGQHHQQPEQLGPSSPQRRAASPTMNEDTRRKTQAVVNIWQHKPIVPLELQLPTPRGGALAPEHSAKVRKHADKFMSAAQAMSMIEGTTLLDSGAAFTTASMHAALDSIALGFRRQRRQLHDEEVPVDVRERLIFERLRQLRITFKRASPSVTEVLRAHFEQEVNKFNAPKTVEDARAMLDGGAQAPIPEPKTKRTLQAFLVRRGAGTAHSTMTRMLLEAVGKHRFNLRESAPPDVVRGWMAQAEKYGVSSITRFDLSHKPYRDDETLEIAMARIAAQEPSITAGWLSTKRAHARQTRIRTKRASMDNLLDAMWRMSAHV